MPDNIFIRIIIAVIACVILFAAIPVALSILDVPKADQISYLIDLCIAGAALYYIVKGKVF